MIFRQSGFPHTVFRTVIRTAILPVWLAVLAGCSQTSQEVDEPVTNGPEQIAAMFYRLLEANPVPGLPGDDALRVFRALFNQSLLHELQSATAAQNRWLASSTPNPPLWQGSPFVSASEGMDSFTLVGCKTGRRTSQCTVDLQVEARGIRHAWQDVIHLRYGRLGWQIVDIDYGGDWPGSAHGQLGKRLTDFVEAAPPAPVIPVDPVHHGGRA